MKNDNLYIILSNILPIIEKKNYFYNKFKYIFFINDFFMNYLIIFLKLVYLLINFFHNYLVIFILFKLSMFFRKFGNLNFLIDHYKIRIIFPINE